MLLHNTKSLAEFATSVANESQSIFCQDMCLTENIRLQVNHLFANVGR